MATTERDDLLPRSGVEQFVRHPVAGAALLLSAAAIALVWANSAWAASYFAWLNTTITVAVGDFVLSKPTQLWINDALMALFFFVVGLEIKREFLAGALSTLRQASFPIIAAIGGMIVPASIYLFFNSGTDTAVGWGVPMATDIAFALGVMAVLGTRVPLALKVFLTAVAVVDDVGAIAVIAFFYSDAIAMASLAVGLGALAIGFAGNLVGIRSGSFYALIGVVVWLGFLKSGVHATLGAVLLALIIPARMELDRTTMLSHLRAFTVRLRYAFKDEQRSLLNHEEHHEIINVATVAGRGTPLLQRMEHDLAPLVSMFVLPVFALANAGVTLNATSVSWDNVLVIGIVLGLLLGKPLGIAGFAWVACKLKLAELPRGVSWNQVVGAGSLAGIGFTMSVFISGLAFESPEQQELAKVAIIIGSFASAIVGSALLIRNNPGTASVERSSGSEGEEGSVEPGRAA